MVKYHRHLVMCCSRGVLWSESKGPKWLIVAFSHHFICVIFDGYLELWNNIVYLCCARIVVCMDIILSEVIGRLLRYPRSKWVWRGALYKGFLKGPFTKVNVFVLCKLIELNICFSLYIVSLDCYYNWNQNRIPLGRYRATQSWSIGGLFKMMILTLFSHFLCVCCNCCRVEL